MQEAQIITSSQAAVNLLRQQLPEGASIFVIGEEGIQEALMQAHFQLTESASRAQAVVVGMDRKVTWRTAMTTDMAEPMDHRAGVKDAIWV